MLTPILAGAFVLLCAGLLAMLFDRRPRRPQPPQQWRCTRCEHVGTSPFDRCYKPSILACPLEPV